MNLEGFCVQFLAGPTLAIDILQYGSEKPL